MLQPPAQRNSKQQATNKPTSQIWSALQIRLHWLVALLLLMQWWSGDSMHSVVEALERQQSLSALQFLTSAVHSYLGIGILLLMLVRLRLRLVNRNHIREITAREPKLQRGLANLTHFCLYAVLIMLAVSGMLSYYEISSSAATFHYWAGWVLLVLLALHFLGAVYHGWYRKDGVVARMWPASWPRF